MKKNLFFVGAIISIFLISWVVIDPANSVEQQRGKSDLTIDEINEKHKQKKLAVKKMEQKVFNEEVLEEFKTYFDLDLSQMKQVTSEIQKHLGKQMSNYTEMKGTFHPRYTLFFSNENEGYAIYKNPNNGKIHLFQLDKNKSNWMVTNHESKQGKKYSYELISQLEEKAEQIVTEKY